MIVIADVNFDTINHGPYEIKMAKDTCKSLSQTQAKAIYLWFVQ